MDHPIRHLYLHIPFCHRICPYCSFYKHQPGGTDLPEFLAAILRETRQLIAHWGARLDLQTIYWGGGTPTLLSTDLLSQFLPEWLAILGSPQPLEWSVEMNPMTLTREKLQLLRSHGVTRASLGVQSWDSAVLQTLGRDHSPEQALHAYQLLREAGFPVVGIDHMFSVPGQTQESWAATLRQSLALKPDHISCYNLTYEEDTAFFESLEKGLFNRDADKDGLHFTTAMEILGNAGFDHYETSNFARPGMESLHNSRYWSGADYLSLGPSAVSTVDRHRWKNRPDTAAYIRTAHDLATLQTEHETLTDEQWRCERIALQLRTAHGVPSTLLGPESTHKAEILLTEGLLHRTEDGFRTTTRGKYLVDSIAEYLI